MCQSLEAISRVVMLVIFFSSFYRFKQRYVKNFPITVCGINLSQQTVSLLAILQ